MKKNLKKFLLLLLIFFLLGTFLTFALYQRVKTEFIENNAMLVGNLMKNHPELEKEIVKILAEPRQTELGINTLKKYGLTSLESLEYLENIHNFQYTFFATFFSFYIVFLIFLILYFYMVEKKRKEEILKIDKYLFSLLSDEIKVDLKDFQSGDLESLQNDLMKVTSRLKNALEHSNTASKELSKTLADISHQLKTPITSLFIINEALSNPLMDSKTRDEFLTRQSQVISHMQTLVINLLKVSQIESGMIELKKENLNLEFLIPEILEELELQIVSKNIQTQVQIQESTTIIGDYVWTKEAILNIVKNGIEHSKVNGKIEITASENPMFVELTIKDYGCGIKKKDIPHIFERFYKSSDAKDSVGIGLNLSKSIFDRMNATIKVKSKEHEYSIFTIHFYKNVV